jgi:hypothetical protein
MDALTTPYERQQLFFSGSSTEIKGGKRKERRKKNKPPKPCHSYFANTHRTRRKPLA